MTKLSKYERFIDIFLLCLFLVSGLFPICTPVKYALESQSEITSYYSCLFNFFSYYSSLPQILMQVLLFIPLVSCIICLICLIYELCKNAPNESASHGYGVSVVIFVVSGMLYATLANCLFPFGMIILGISLGIGIIKVIFHFGFRALRV